jgi:tetratricopeptide (TPR) repeat protein
MPETAKILAFPRRPQIAISAADAAEAAESLFSGAKDVSEEFDQELFANPDFLVSACKLLRDATDVTPQVVAQHAAALYERISESASVGLFDERDYFLGESALIAGRAFRHLGQRDEAERWLDRAEACFRHTLNPGPSLANVTYARLALKYEMRRYQEVVELVPSLARSYERLGMPVDASKARFLLAASLKLVGRHEQAYGLLEQIRADQAVKTEPGLLGQVLVEMGEYCATKSDFAAATTNFQEALPLLKTANRPLALANLKFVLGEAFRQQGNLTDAHGAFKEALVDCRSLGMTTYVAYLHILLAETLLAMDRPREAEWEILAALPTIDRERMAPEGIAAVGLLHDSVSRRKTDPKALQEVRELLQKLA